MVESSNSIYPDIKVGDYFMFDDFMAHHEINLGYVVAFNGDIYTYKTTDGYLGCFKIAIYKNLTILSYAEYVQKVLES
jgi:asparagine synthetase B (glutamine-hydrolysing)